MDHVALQILRAGLEQDSRVVQNAAQRAQQHLHEGHPGSLEACGFELQRLYNVLEKSFERVCEAFENHFEKRADYHEKMIERMTLALPGIRPPFLPGADWDAVRELKSFRHVFRHAYELQLRSESLARLAAIGARIADAFPVWTASFVAEVDRELRR